MESTDETIAISTVYVMHRRECQRDSGRKRFSDWLWAAEYLDTTAQRSRLV